LACVPAAQRVPYYHKRRATRRVRLCPYCLLQATNTRAPAYFQLLLEDQTTAPATAGGCANAILRPYTTTLNCEARARVRFASRWTRARTLLAVRQDVQFFHRARTAVGAGSPAFIAPFYASILLPTNTRTLSSRRARISYFGRRAAPSNVLRFTRSQRRSSAVRHFHARDATRRTHRDARAARYDDTNTMYAPLVVQRQACLFLDAAFCRTVSCYPSRRPCRVLAADDTSGLCLPAALLLRATLAGFVRRYPAFTITTAILDVIHGPA